MLCTSWFSERFGWAPRSISHHLCSVVKSDFIKTISDPCLTDTAKGEAERLIRFSHTHTHTHCIIRVVVGLCASVNRVMFEWVEGRSLPLITSRLSTHTHTRMSTHTNDALLQKHGIPPSSFLSSFITSLSSITFLNRFFLSSLCPHRCRVPLWGGCCRITVLLDTCSMKPNTHSCSWGLLLLLLTHTLMQNRPSCSCHPKWCS